MKRLWTILSGTILLGDAFVLGVYIGAGQWHWSVVVMSASSLILYIVGLIIIVRRKP